MPSRDAAKVRPATDEWGCATDGCLEKARVVITDRDGGQWGACGKHIKAVKRDVGA